MHVARRSSSGWSRLVSLYARACRVAAAWMSNPLASSGARLLSGSLVAMLIYVGLTPFLSRLYDAAEFGAFGLYVSLVSIGTVIAALRYENAVVLPSSDEVAIALVRVSAFCIAGISTLLALASAILYFSDLREFGSTRSILPWLALGVLFAAAYQLFTFWRVRRSQYQTISSTRITRSAGGGLAQLMFGFAGAGVIGLIVGQLIGQLAALWSIRKRVDAVDDALIGRPIWGARETSAAREYKNFPIYDLPQATLNSLSQQVPVLLLTTLVGPTSAGLFVMASRVLMLPVTMAGQSVRPVLLKGSSDAKNAGERITPVVGKALTVLALLSLPGAVLLMISAPAAFAWVLGEDWRESGLYAAILAPWLFLLFVKESVIGLVPVLGLQRFMLIFESASLVARVAAMSAGAYWKGGVGAVAFFSVAASLSNACVIVMLWRYARANDAARMTGTANYTAAEG